MAGPITPEEVVGRKAALIPEAVYEAFNELIAEHWIGSDSAFTVAAAKTRIRAKSGLDTVLPHWLDVEPIYRDAGWSVTLDRPGYDENYDARYIFRKK